MSQARILFLLFFLLTTICCIGQNNSVNELLYANYKQGKKEYNYGDYYKAIKLFEQVIKAENDSTDITELSAKSYHKLAKCQRRLGRKSEGLQMTIRGLEILEDINKSSSMTAADLWAEKSNLLRALSRIKEAEEAFQKCLDTAHKLLGEASIYSASLKMTQGSIYADANELRKAEDSYLSAIEILHRSEGDKRSLFSKLYLNIGNVYRNMGHYEASRNYLEKALKLKQELYGKDHIRVAKYYGSLGRTLSFLGNHQEALLNKEKELQISLASKNIGAKRIGAVYNELASVYHSKGDSTECIDLLEIGISKMEKAADKSDLYICRSYGNMARYYEEYANRELALSNIDIAINRYTVNPHVLSHELADFLRVKARILLSLGKEKEALTTINEAYELMPVENKYDKIKLLHIRSQILLQLSQDTNVEFLEHAYESCLESLQIIEDLKFSSRKKEIHRAFSEYTYSQYDMAVLIAYKLYLATNDIDYLHKAWQFSDKSKASLLWKDLKDKEAIESGIISQEKISARQILMDEIQFLQGKLKSSTKPTVQDSLQNELDKKQSAFYSNTRALENTYPIYYERKFTNPSPNLSLIQNKLDANSIVVNYHTFQEEILIFTISKDKFTTKLVSIPTNLDNNIQALHQFSINKKDQQKYIDQLLEIYDLLIKPIEDPLNNKSHLIIIPHNYLNYLAFETLIEKSNESDFRKLPYLIKKYSIEYAWSTDLWLNKKANNSKSTTPYSGYAPGFRDSTKSTNNPYRNIPMELPFSLQEISVGKGIFDGQLYTNDQASKEQFIQHAPESRIFHLATHGIMDTKNPSESGILFSGSDDNSFLTASEIYGLHFTSELAVMTACNTGNGPLDKGEGIMSLGRAFFQSGCSSILSSIWLANDESTSKVISLFYQYSAEGLSKNEALQQAKIQYLQETDALTAHPHFWANLTAMGNMESLKPRTYILFYVSLGALLLGICVVGIWMYSSK